MVELILYTTHCPKCEILKAKLDAKNIKKYSLKGWKTLK